MPASSPVVISDPDDDPILQTAIIGRVDVLCRAFVHEIVKQVCLANGVRIVGDVALNVTEIALILGRDKATKTNG